MAPQIYSALVICKIEVNQSSDFFQARPDGCLRCENQHPVGAGGELAADP